MTLLGDLRRYSAVYNITRRLSTTRLWYEQDCTSSLEVELVCTEGLLKYSAMPWQTAAVVEQNSIFHILRD